MSWVLLWSVLPRRAQGLLSTSHGTRGRQPTQNTSSSLLPLTPLPPYPPLHGLIRDGRAKTASCLGIFSFWAESKAARAAEQEPPVFVNLLLLVRYDKFSLRKKKKEKRKVGAQCLRDV